MNASMRKNEFIQARGTRREGRRKPKITLLVVKK